MKQMIFCDNYEIQTILFLVAISFVNYAYSISFGHTFGAKFLFLENINSCGLNYT